MKCLCLSTAGIFKIEEKYITGSELTVENLVIKITAFFCDDIIGLIPLIK